MSGSNVPTLDMYRPSVMMTHMIYYSPLLVCISILFLSFVFNNMKGFIYLGFLLAATIMREFLYYAVGVVEERPISPDSSICNMVGFGKNGINTYSAFMLAFTIVYMCLPMYLNDSMNYMVLGVLLIYMISDLSVRFMSKCLQNMSMLFLNITAGIITGMAIVGSMTAGGSGEHLFFNEVQSDKVICSRPSEQQFKCAVYKGGELISSSVV